MSNHPFYRDMTGRYDQPYDMWTCLKIWYGGTGQLGLKSHGAQLYCIYSQKPIEPASIKKNLKIPVLPAFVFEGFTEHKLRSYT